MRYEQFGSTGFQVSSLGFGAMNLPGVPLEQAKLALNFALDQGINYIDTAAAYRNSEEIIGESISHRRQEYFLATKTQERGYEKAKESIERSLIRLRTDYLDLVQIHYVNYVEEYKTIMGERGAYQALLEAKQQGKVRFIGISGHRPDLLTRWISKGQYDQVLFHLSLVQPFALQQLIPTAIQLGMARTAMKPLSGGFVQPVHKAIRYPYSQSVNTIISGMVSVDEVRENISMMDIEVGNEEKQELEQLAMELGSHSCRRCNYCSCPIGISIPDIMISSIVRDKFGLLPKGQQWFAKNKEKITACSDYEPCRIKPLCEDTCPYDLPMQQTVQLANQYYTS